LVVPAATTWAGAATDTSPPRVVGRAATRRIPEQARIARGLGRGVCCTLGQADNEAREDTMDCTTCGHELPAGAHFCPGCGAPQDEQAPAPPPIAGTVYGPVIAAQVEQERARKSTIEARGLTIVQTSGGFLVLFSAVVGAIQGTQTTLPAPSLALFMAAVGLFALAAALGLYAYWHHNSVAAYGGIEADVLAGWMAGWDDPNAAAASKVVAAEQLRVLREARRFDGPAKRYAVTYGIFAELLAIVCLALAAANLVYPR
jgi:hypothetical protein